MVYVTPRVCIIIVVIINVMFVVLIVFKVGQNALFMNIITRMLYYGTGRARGETFRRA